MDFQVQRRLESSLGRAGKLTTAHGAIDTPAFVAVGTKATVKSLTPDQIKATGAQVVLGNTYHLYLEPGEKIVKEAGGLGAFMGWQDPTMTDSGGFQVFSLGAAFNRVNRSKISSHKSHTNKLDLPAASAQAGIVGMTGEREAGIPPAKIDEDGVTFKSQKDGSTHRFTPERSIEIQHALGADIIFAFDECTSPDAPHAYQKAAMERTHRWAARCLRQHREFKVESLKLKVQEKREEQALFGIVQGGRFEDLRKESARVVGAKNFDGFGIGGSFDKEDMQSAVRWVNEILPEEKPRHLLGIGDPMDLFDAVENGCDLFDCVAPTREARNGSLYTKHGRINIENARYKTELAPVEANCECYTCSHFTAAYLSHLFRSREILANTLATIHNLFFIVNLVKNMRRSILDKTFHRFREDFLGAYVY